MKYIGTYSNEADIATKAKVDAKQDKVLANGILKGDGQGAISAAETQEVELVTLTKADVGLGNVDNTSDLNKPISTATQAALNGKQATIAGGASTITTSNLTDNRALVSNADGKVAVSAVTATELGYLDGVTSNIQTQLNGKLSTAPVTSVNSKAGAVELVASDVGALATSGGTMAGGIEFTVGNDTYSIELDNSQRILYVRGKSKNGGIITISDTAPFVSIGTNGSDSVNIIASTNQTIIRYVQTPTNNTDAANKKYVDDAVSGISGLPAVTTADNGKFLRVVNGAWAAAEVANANGVSF
nr:MAG TPA: Putative tail fiber protein [Caudoviricetes sp.]